MYLGRHLLSEKNMAEVMQCDIRLNWRKPCHFHQFLLRLALGAFSHHVRPATVGQPSEEMMWRWEKVLGREGGREREREREGEDSELLAIRVCPAQVLTCKLRRLQGVSVSVSVWLQPQEMPWTGNTQLNSFHAQITSEINDCSHFKSLFQGGLFRGLKHWLLLELTFLPLFVFFLQ